MESVQNRRAIAVEMIEMVIGLIDGSISAFVILKLRGRG